MPVKAARVLDGRGGARTLDAAGLQNWSTAVTKAWISHWLRASGGRRGVVSPADRL